MGYTNLKNKFDYYLRQKLKFKRGHFPISNEEKTDLFEDLEPELIPLAEAKENNLFQKYKLDYLKAHSTKRNYLENLYIIEFLESTLCLENSKDSISVLDIGSKNWFYAKGEYQFFKYNAFKKDIKMTGIEIDAYRVYSSLYSRYDSAMNNIKGLENTYYIAGDLLEHKDKYDYISWFFPFITEDPLVHWGLPLDLYQPQRLLSHAYNLLNNNGTMIIMNQGIEEHEIQKKLLEQQSIKFTELGQFTSLFLEYEHDRYYLKVSK